jgi:hypothetical protein
VCTRGGQREYVAVGEGGDGGVGSEEFNRVEGDGVRARCGARAPVDGEEVDAGCLDGLDEVYGLSVWK